MLRLLRLWRLGGRDLRLLWYAVWHPDRPIWLLPVTVLMGFFALEPANFVMPVLGLVDDLVLLPLLLHGLLKFLPAQIRGGFELKYPAGANP